MFTDHRPLAQAVRCITNPWSPRQQCQLSALSEFLSDIEYLPGARNIAADALSRSPIASVCFGFDFSDLSIRQQQSPEIKAYRMAITGLQLRDVTLSPGGPSLLCNLSTGNPQPVNPPAARRLAFDLLHGLSHPGVRATQQLVGDWFVWFNMRKDIVAWCRSCHSCQANKVHKHHHSPIHVIPIPEKPFYHVHMDLLAPPPPTLYH